MKHLLLLTLFILIAWGCRRYGSEVAINNRSHVYYKGGASQKEATQLGSFLLRQGYFNSTENKAVQLSKNGKTYVIRFILNEPAVHDWKMDKENINFSFTVWREWIIEHVFPGKSVKVILVDEELKRLAEVKRIQEN